MDHFPIFLATEGRRIVLSGGGEAAEAKLRLLLKTRAKLTVFADEASDTIKSWASQGALRLVPRVLEPGDTLCAALFYAANEDDVEDARTAAIARAEGALVNIVDNLHDSQFITPAIVDRDPVTVAIGTEGAGTFYKGDLAQRMVDHVREGGGMLTLSDLENFVLTRVFWIQNAEPIGFETFEEVFVELGLAEAGIEVACSR